MKAFIFNSGVGSRMGELTNNNPKGLVRLTTGETLLGRQLRILKANNINDVVISTGYLNTHIEESCKDDFPDLNFTFVYNEIYKTTNSIYSMFLAEKFFDDDFIIMHGDLVFSEEVISKVLRTKHKDVAFINKSIEKPQKDFKGRVIDGELKKIAVDIFEETDYALQPLYKLSRQTIKRWFERINHFVSEGNTKVYAENALNQVLESLTVKVLDYHEDYLEEIDNIEDYNRVSAAISSYDYASQQVVAAQDYIKVIENYVVSHNLKRPYIVHSKHVTRDPAFQAFADKYHATLFTDYSPNPKYEEIIAGLEKFKDSRNDVIIAIGGGSCIDVAKAIKLFSKLDSTKNYLSQKHIYVALPLIAVPTTAGTGTESTRYSVIYFEGEKQSLTNDSLLPNLAILNPIFLEHLPEYHRKSALLDAFCQAIESFWSVNSTELSQAYSKHSLELFLANYEAFLNNDQSVNEKIMECANYAGRAINITQTTAPHALSYKLTTLTGIAHGHAVSLTVPHVLEEMLKNSDNVNDLRGAVYVQKMFSHLANFFSTSLEQLPVILKQTISNFNLGIPAIEEKVLFKLTNSVNVERLKNNPVSLNYALIMKIYKSALNIN